jgi:uncharacterized membrane protein YdjX (TVP38/TMEM64 family)
MSLVARNGFQSSFLIRLAPAAPFIFVNMAAGAAGMSPFDFLGGTALGIAPKILLTGLAGHSIGELAHGRGLGQAAVIGLALAVWVLLGAAGYRWLRRREAQAAP